VRGRGCHGVPRQQTDVHRGARRRREHVLPGAPESSVATAVVRTIAFVSGPSRQHRGDEAPCDAEVPEQPAQRLRRVRGDRREHRPHGRRDARRERMPVHGRSPARAAPSQASRAASTRARRLAGGEVQRHDAALGDADHRRRHAHAGEDSVDDGAALVDDETGFDAAFAHSATIACAPPPAVSSLCPNDR
jgi:hypothetical protein